MARRRRRAWGSGCALAVLATACAAGGVVSTAPAASAAGCAGEKGVLVVVDFGPLGGGIERGCARGNPSSGYDALHNAGFTTAGTKQYGPSFVCRIDKKPSVRQQSCTNTPPSKAHWSYWHGLPGKSRWVLSSVAVTGYDPRPGEIEAWSFGDGGRPRMSLADVRSGRWPSARASNPVSSRANTPAAAGASTPHAGRAGAADTGTTTMIGVLIALAVLALAAAWVANRRRGSGD